MTQAETRQLSHREQRNKHEAELGMKILSKATYYELLARAFYTCHIKVGMESYIPVVMAAYDKYVNDSDKMAVVEVLRTLAEANL